MDPMALSTTPCILIGLQHPSDHGWTEVSHPGHHEHEEQSRPARLHLAIWYRRSRSASTLVLGPGVALASRFAGPPSSLVSANGFFEVRSFGAAGDGTHLDSAAINQAVLAASRMHRYCRRIGKAGQLRRSGGNRCPALFRGLRTPALA
jgi:hypothetical protein